MTEIATRIPRSLHSSRVMIPLTAGFCLILLAVVLKNVLFVPAQQLANDMILYIIIYIGFIVSFQFQDDTGPGSSVRVLLWMGAIIVATLGIVIVYAI